MGTRTIVHMIFLISFFLISCCAGQDDGYRLWLKYSNIQDVDRLDEYCRFGGIYVFGDTPTHSIIRRELRQGFHGICGKEIPLLNSPENAGVLVGIYGKSGIIRQIIPEIDTLQLVKDGFYIRFIVSENDGRLVVTAKTTPGLLYGTFHLLRILNTEVTLQDINFCENPKIQYRLLNHWDNVNGSVERGYAGRTLWKWDELPDTKRQRYEDYARANASIGINGTVLNNVNANPVFLTRDYLKKVAAIADIFRPYGIRVFLAINFSSPMSGRFDLENNRSAGVGKLDTADPLNPNVLKWWQNKAQEIYQLIPDFGGFLVKANSEGMPGPQNYDRTHAEGANMLAEALAPFGGIVMWRAFVYNADVDPDRAKRSYLEFVPLDGQFKRNVFVQAKNGPIDFQPREPVQPLFGAMPKTPMMLELQITQEYLGHSTHLVYLAPMWKEYLQFDTFAQDSGSTLASIIDGSIYPYHMTGIAGVSNIGDDRNWCGHLFAQANWYAYGRLAWNHELTAEQIADEWIKQSLSRDKTVLSVVKDMMLGSWEACVNYMTPLGLHHIMQVGFHYGPQPDWSGGRRKDWTSVYYHRADEKGLGFDRTSTGSYATAQYFSPLSEQFENMETCPEKYLLWFFHVPWEYKMKSGYSLWEELCLHYYTGTQYVDSMIEQWNGLEGKLDPNLYNHVKEKLLRQQTDAKIWRDTCLKYFQTFSGMDIFQTTEE
ncbi:alpha-glucuronidase [candidate division KSB1 bacterium]|nr:alpha-glucuronidase [candidate division KSB1 bacterium]